MLVGLRVATLTQISSLGKKEAHTKTLMQERKGEGKRKREMEIRPSWPPGEDFPNCKSTL